MLLKKLQIGGKRLLAALNRSDIKSLFTINSQIIHKLIFRVLLDLLTFIKAQMDASLLAQPFQS